MKITLKDGSEKGYERSMSVLDIAKDISEGLARAATCAPAAAKSYTTTLR